MQDHTYTSHRISLREADKNIKERAGTLYFALHVKTITLIHHKILVQMLYQDRYRRLPLCNVCSVPISSPYGISHCIGVRRIMKYVYNSDGDPNYWIVFYRASQS